MTDGAQAEALRRLRAAAAEVNKHEAERQELAAAIVEALTAGGMRPTEVEKEVPYDRNHIRRIAKAAGVPPLREPTVTSRRKPSARRPAPE